MKPSPLKQLSLSGTAIGKNVVVGRVAISSREIAHMQVGKCNNQEAHAESFLPQAQDGPRHRCED